MVKLLITRSILQYLRLENLREILLFQRIDGSIFKLST